MVRTFSSLSFHHSSPIIHHSSLITQNFSIFTPLCLDAVFTPNNSNISSLFVGPQLNTQSVIIVVYPRINSQILQFSFPLHPENRVPLPTHTQTLYSCVEAPSPRLVSVYHRHFRSSLASPRLRLLLQV